MDLQRPPTSGISPWMTGQMRWSPGLSRAGDDAIFRTTCPTIAKRYPSSRLSFARFRHAAGPHLLNLCTTPDVKLGNFQFGSIGVYFVAGVKMAVLRFSHLPTLTPVSQAEGQQPFRTPRGQSHLVPMSTSGAYPPGASSHDPYGALVGARREHPHERPRFLPPRYPQAPSGHFAPFPPFPPGGYRGSGSHFDHDTNNNRKPTNFSESQRTSSEDCPPKGCGVVGTGDGNRDWVIDRDPNDEEFGVMAPCWRLLERAKSFMEQVSPKITSSFA